MVGAFHVGVYHAIKQEKVYTQGQLAKIDSHKLKT